MIIIFIEPICEDFTLQFSGLPAASFFMKSISGHGVDNLPFIVYDMYVLYVDSYNLK